MQRRDKTVQSTACQDKLPSAKKQTPKRVEAGFQARSNGFLIDKNYLLVYQPYTLPTKTSFLSHTSHSNAPCRMVANTRRRAETKHTDFILQHHKNRGNKRVMTFCETIPFIYLCRKFILRKKQKGYAHQTTTHHRLVSPAGHGHLGANYGRRVTVSQARISRCLDSNCQRPIQRNADRTDETHARTSAQLPAGSGHQCCHLPGTPRSRCTL